MTFFSNAMSGGTSQFMVDPTAAQTTELTTLTANHAALGTADCGLSEFISSVQGHMSSELAAMSQRLPLMSAFDGLQKQASLAEGTLPGSDGGSLFNTAMSSLTSVGDMLSSLQTRIQNLLATAPPAPTGTNPDGTPVTNETAVTIQGWLDEAKTQMAAAATASAAAATTAISQMQSFGFATFLTGDQPPAVKEILGQFTNVPASAKTEKDMIAVASQNLQGSVTPVTYTLPNSEALAKPTVTPEAKPMDPAKFSALKADVDRTKAAVDAAKITYDQSLANCQAWQDSHNYRAVKQRWRESSDPAAAAEWKALKARYEEEVYNHHMWEHANYALARDDYFKACDAYQAAIGVPYQG